MVTSGGSGTMGYGLPACVGAKLAAPDKIVIDIDGDASFCMTAMELATAAQFGINIKVNVSSPQIDPVSGIATEQQFPRHGKTVARDFL